MQAKSEHLAGVIGLGDLVAEYGHRAINRRAALFFAITGLGATPFILSLTIIGVFDVVNRYGWRSSRIADTLIPASCFLIMALIVGGGSAWGWWRIRNLVVGLYQQGLAMFDHQGLRQIRWDEAEAIWQSVTRHQRYGRTVNTTHLYTVQKNDGTQIILDDRLVDVGTLGNKVITTCSMALLPKLIGRYNSGQRVEFGPLAIDKEGIYHKNKPLPWNEVTSVDMQRGWITVRKGKRKWANVAVAQTPNALIFWQMVKQIRGG